MSEKGLLSRLEALIASIKAKKKSYGEIENEIAVELSTLEDEFHAMIKMEQKNMRFGTLGSKKQASARLKNACKSYLIVQTARQYLFDISSANQLYSLMNRMSDAFKDLNKLSDKSESVNTKKLGKRIGKMENAKDAREEEIEFDFSEVTNLPSDLLERMSKGASFEECMASRDSETDGELYQPDPDMMLEPEEPKVADKEWYTRQINELKNKPHN